MPGKARRVRCLTPTVPLTSESELLVTSRAALRWRAAQLRAEGVGEARGPRTAARWRRSSPTSKACSPKRGPRAGAPAASRSPRCSGGGGGSSDWPDTADSRRRRALPRRAPRQSGLSSPLRSVGQRSSSACSKSARRSSMFSMPTETRTSPSGMPAAARSSGDTSTWLVVAGGPTRVPTEPRLAARCA